MIDSLLVVLDRHDVGRRVGKYVPNQVRIATLAGHV